MTTFFFVILLVGVGFGAGYSVGTRHGYDLSMRQVRKVIDQIEALYRRELRK